MFSVALSSEQVFSLAPTHTHALLGVQYRGVYLISIIAPLLPGDAWHTHLFFTIHIFSDSKSKILDNLESTAKDTGKINTTQTHTL